MGGTHPAYTPVSMRHRSRPAHGSSRSCRARACLLRLRRRCAPRWHGRAVYAADAQRVADRDGELLAHEVEAGGRLRDGCST